MSSIIPTVNPVFAKRSVHRNNSQHAQIWQLLDQVYDPELPGLTIWDLGILQDVQLVDHAEVVGVENSADLADNKKQWLISITPTYSGCPAVDAIKQDVQTVLQQAGYKNIEVKVVLAPAWTTEMMSPAGKAHLKSIQIAPPDIQDKVSCPVCESEHTRLVSQFGSTACKALYQCQDCLEHFDYFKHF
jgi:ring-1,2-phenylacetyl-CoA epoxidase subunit PaaD